MMRLAPVRIDHRPAEGETVDPSLAVGILFWMNLVALAVITATF